MVDVSDNADYSFSYATIKGVGSDGATSDYLSLYGSGSTEAIGNKLASESYPALGTTTGGGMFAGVSGYGVGSSFLVELWAESATENVDPTRVAWGTLAYSTVLNSVYSGMSQSGASPYTVTASQVVPEPTSGLLALLGFAALALRRKQKKA